MNSQSAQIGERGPAPPRSGGTDRTAQPDRGGIDEGSSLARAARLFATRCHARQWRDSDGARFIEHPLEVARMLRAAGCSDAVVAAGLLHDVLEDTAVGADELRARFGADVATLVVAVSDDAQGGSYRERKHRLREQVRRAGADAAIVFAADKISKVRELKVAYEHDASAAAAGRGRFDTRRELVRRLQIEHYHESLKMLRAIAPRHALVERLAEELSRCPYAETRRVTDLSHGTAGPRR